MNTAQGWELWLSCRKGGLGSNGHGLLKDCWALTFRIKTADLNQCSFERSFPWDTASCWRYFQQHRPSRERARSRVCLCFTRAFLVLGNYSLEGKSIPAFPWWAGTELGQPTLQTVFLLTPSGCSSTLRWEGAREPQCLCYSFSLSARAPKFIPNSYWKCETINLEK